MRTIDKMFGESGPARSAPGRLARAALGRLFYPMSDRLRFRGVFGSYADALSHARKGKLAGCDNDAVVDVSFDSMCELALWDYPVLFWLKRLAPETRRLLDAGGHMGTKYRAFRRHLDLSGLDWIVYDVPAVVRAGRARAAADGIDALAFVDTLEEAGEVDVMLASGLLQYLDQPLTEFMRRLSRLPEHVVFNKVATRAGGTVVTLENLGVAEVPYQMRDLDGFLAELDALGYEVVDQWDIPYFSHVIPTHLELGGSTSRGVYARLKADR